MQISKFLPQRLNVSKMRSGEGGLMRTLQGTRRTVSQSTSPGEADSGRSQGHFQKCCFKTVFFFLSWQRN